MRPGITLQHSRDVIRDNALVRNDVTGFISVVTKARWPKGIVKGDFMELPLRAYADLEANPAKGFFDPVTRRSVRNFFVNGGDAGGEEEAAE